MTVNKLNFVYFGTPDISSKTLEILKKNGYIPSLIITSPDKKSGRGLLLKESPVSLWAKNNDINIYKPEKIDTNFIEEIKSLNFDISIVVAYGKILPEKLIQIPKFGTLNIHYSLLPKYRGASPVESALLNGESKTGISIQKMKFELDSGPIIKEVQIDIGILETKEILKSKLTILGGETLVNVLNDLDKIIKNSVDQIEENATYCKKIKKEYGLIKLDDEPITLWNKYRAYKNWPGLYFFIKRNNKLIRVKIKEATYENNSFIVKRVVPESKKEIDYSVFLNQN